MSQITKRRLTETLLLFQRAVDNKIADALVREMNGIAGNFAGNLVDGDVLIGGLDTIDDPLSTVLAKADVSLTDWRNYQLYAFVGTTYCVVTGESADSFMTFVEDNWSALRDESLAYGLRLLHTYIRWLRLELERAMSEDEHALAA